MSLFESTAESDALLINRLDPTELLGCAIERPFQLDDHQWLTAEHYYQAMKYPGHRRFDEIRSAADAEAARKIGRGWLKRPRDDWPKIRTVIMTRAIYTQARTHSDFAEALLATDNRLIQDSSLYDYFWGTGRDQRGNNAYGQVLMDVRTKLQQEARDASSEVNKPAN